MRIEVENTDVKLREALKTHWLTAPNACFQNCFSAVAIFGEAAGDAMSYVLCWLIDNFGQRHPHALICFNNKYHDLTLQSNPKATGYVQECWLKKSSPKMKLFACLRMRVVTLDGTVLQWK